MGIYSKELRIRALAAVDRGIPRREQLVETCSISLRTLKRWLRMRREGKDLSPGVSTGRKRRILSTLQQRRLLWSQLQENDDASLEHHCELWEEKTGARVSVSTMSRAIREKLGWSYKKTLGATERDEEARSAFRERLRSVDPKRLIFVDESSTNISLTPRYSSQLLAGAEPHRRSLLQSEESPEESEGKEVPSDALRSHGTGGA